MRRNNLARLVLRRFPPKGLPDETAALEEGVAVEEDGDRED